MWAEATATQSLDVDVRQHDPNHVDGRAGRPLLTSVVSTGAQALLYASTNRNTSFPERGAKEETKGNVTAATVVSGWAAMNGV